MASVYQRKIRVRHGRRSTPNPGKRWIISKKDAVKYGSPEYRELEERLSKAFAGKENGGLMMLVCLSEATRKGFTIETGTTIYRNRKMLAPISQKQRKLTG